MCEWCEYKEKEWLLHESLNWSVYLSDEQDYVGRCILVLNRHCGSVSELNMSEWMELKTIMDKLEYIYKEAIPNPHLHLHVRPRYKNAIVINDYSYIDEEFAHHYALKKEDRLRDDDKRVLYALIKKYFTV